ncbi:MAG: 3-phosphoshikimate 1-carboxyvinyltransferase [Proteobacteria bacterium]|nr:3-phosphoshikimate 1-carboxyvinyltransferase [Pseudomonadota bacterium]
MTKRLLSQPGGVPSGTHVVPGDKSISHRALLVSAIAAGRTRIENFLDGSDCRATASALRALGVGIAFENPTRVCVIGVKRLASPRAPLDLGNSGTGLRLLAGLFAGHDVDVTLTGDASLRSRPMQRVARPLNEMGANVGTSADGASPLRIHGRSTLRGIDYTMPVASAQVKSAILLAGLAATEAVVVREPAVTRDHTERMLQAFGARISREGGAIRLEPGAALRSPGQIDVPGDLSSAAFLFAAAAMTPGASVTVTGVGVNPSRAGVLDLLVRMGAKVSLADPRETSGEPVADITVTGATLHGITIFADDVALSVDEIPVLLAVAAIAEGETRVLGAGELKVKESDRLAAMVDGLVELGVSARLLDDGVCVFGGQPQGGIVDSRGDHRIAMSFAVLGQRAKGAVEILDCENIETSFPGFASLMQSAGLDISETAS